jgi:hypothetical protein
MVSFLASLHSKISSEVFETAAMMKSMSSIVSTVCICGLVALEFFHEVGFVGETFIFLEVSASSIGSLGGVTSPYLCLYSFPLSPSLSTSSLPPPPSESEVVSSDAMLRFYTSSFFFLLLLLGASYSSLVTKGPLLGRGQTVLPSRLVQGALRPTP